MKQHTLKQSCSFCGAGLHTGAEVRMTVCPAPENHGIVFSREDMGGARVRASIENVCGTRRSTMLRSGKACVRTTEHLLSAMVGMGIDNALVKLDGPELPILDGSALPYAAAFKQAGLQEQEAERRYFEIKEKTVFKNILTGSRIVMEPSQAPLYEATIDFRSKVIGVQSASLSQETDYAAEIAPCRTFCFLSDIVKLRKAGLIKGGTLDNALVVDEPRGYYNNTPLRFDNECARHKLLDMVGDFALLGAPVKGRISAWKPGHKANTGAARLLARKSNRKKWN